MAYDRVSNQRQLMGIEPREWTTPVRRQIEVARLEEDRPGEMPPEEMPDDGLEPGDEEDGLDTGDITSPSPHWEMYRELEQTAVRLHGEVKKMHARLSEVTEGGMTREQRLALRRAQKAIKETLGAQAKAFRRVSEFGSTLLGQ